jgi:molecular chaperone GrpE
MNDVPFGDDATPPLTEIVAAPASGEESAVEFVVPAVAYDTVLTDDELVARVESGQEPAAPPAPVVELSELRGTVQTLSVALGKRIDALQTVFEREIRAEATREKVVDRLHAELQEYKQDLLLNTLRPMFIDLIQLHDDMGKLVEARSCDSDSARWLETIRDFQQAIEDILYRHGVEPFVLPDAIFDPRRQRAATTVPTDDPAQAKTVAAHIRKGFQAREKVIRPEIVAVYAFKR